MVVYIYILKCWCHVLNVWDKQANNHESRFNLFELINQQCSMYMFVAGLERMTIGSVAMCLTLSYYTGRLTDLSDHLVILVRGDVSKMRASYN